MPERCPSRAVPVLAGLVQDDPRRWPAPRRREQSGRPRTTAPCPPVPGRWSRRPRSAAMIGDPHPCGRRRHGPVVPGVFTHALGTIARGVLAPAQQVAWLASTAGAASVAKRTAWRGRSEYRQIGGVILRGPRAAHGHLPPGTSVDVDGDRHQITSSTRPAPALLRRARDDWQAASAARAREATPEWPRQPRP